MKIAVLCFRSYDAYAAQSELALQEAARGLGHSLDLVQVSELQFSPDGEILLSGEKFPDYDVLISRARVIDQVENRLFVLKLLQEKGFSVINSYSALCQSKNKWFATESLRKAGVATVPTWVVEDEVVALRTAQNIGYPVVVKACYGTYGLGVAKAENKEDLRKILDRFWRTDFIQPILLQPFILEAQSKDHRVFVVGNQVVASMERKAPEGDFRAYSPKAEDAVAIEISTEERDLAVQAVAAVGLDYAGVDIIQTKKGPAVLEVNGNAGLMRISHVTGVDVPKAIIEFAVARSRKAE